MKRIPLKHPPKEADGQPKLLDISHLTVRRGKLKEPTEHAYTLIEHMASKGMSETAICYCLGLGSATWVQWKFRYPEIVELVKYGHAVQINRATEVVNHHLNEYNLTAAFFVLNRHQGESVEANRANDKAETAQKLLRLLTDDELREVTTIVGRAAGRAIVDGTATAVG